MNDKQFARKVERQHFADQAYKEGVIDGSYVKHWNEYGSGRMVDNQDPDYIRGFKSVTGKTPKEWNKEY